MFGAGGVRGNKRQVDFSLQHRGQFHLGLLSRFLQPLQRHAVLGKIYALVLAEFFHNPVDHALVNVVAAQVGVAIGRFHLDHAFAYFKD